MSDGLRQLLDPIPVIPVLTVRRIEDAVPLADALVKGGLPVLEVTLRTEAAIEAMRRMAAEVPEATVGAGTLTRAEDVETVLRAGARFAVSPGLTPELAAAAQTAGLPLLPGVMTPSEALAARDRGFELLKFFPAEPAGSVAMLKAFRGPLPDLLFCPTGGIGAANFRDYLALPNVICVGGSWVAPRALVAAGDWAGLTELARQTFELGAKTL